MYRQLQHVLLFLMLITGLSSQTQATSILEVDTDELVDRAGVIFEAEVIASEGSWNASRTYISTHVTFRVIEVLKGTLDSGTLTQSFAGGTVDGMSLDVDGMVYPQVGERGIYFLENPSRAQANPLVGWGQGHFRVNTDSQGQQRIATENGAPVTGLTAQPAALQRRAHPSGAPLSHGVARGVMTAPAGSSLESAMDRQSFKRALRDKISERAQHANTPGNEEAQQ